MVPGLKGYNPDATYRFFEQAREGVAALPGVRRTSYAIRLPAQANESGWAADFTIPGKQPPTGEQYFRIKYTMVGPNYFELMGTRILQGRGVSTTDRPNSSGIAVINRFMADRLWPHESAIGKTIMMGRQHPTPREIVGIAEDNKIAGLYEEQQMYVYVPYAQERQSFGILLVETGNDPQTAIAPVRQKLAQIDPAIPVLDTGSFASYMNLVLYEERRDAFVLMGVSALTLFLGVVGVYGVVSLVTSRRTREIGIRMALGARDKEVMNLILCRVLKLTSCGVLLEVVAGLAAGRLMQTRLHGIAATDPWSVLIGASILFAAATIAGALPSWHAAHVNPTEALRHQ